MRSIYFATILFLCSIASVAQTKQTTRSDLDINQILTRVWNDSKVYIPKGRVADYIPELGKADENLVGLAVMDSSGKLYTKGDTKARFTMQSISKVIALMVAINERGEDYIFERVNCYGTDTPFNSFARLESDNKPLNPMMNAGAILTTSLIEGVGDIPYQKILAMIRYITKNDSIDYSHSVFLSEKETGHRNRGMFYILKNSGLIQAEDESGLDNYFRQCSIEVDAEDLAKIAYFFAHGCTRFDGDKTYYNPQMSRLVNSVILTAGMYDYSGEYSRKVGVPSKSGVGGGIMAVVPGKYGIGTFNPSLDEHGNSAPGVFMLEELNKELDLSIF